MSKSIAVQLEAFVVNQCSLEATKVLYCARTDLGMVHRDRNWSQTASQY